jgi:hypothetical protein
MAYLYGHGLLNNRSKYDSDEDYSGATMSNKTRNTETAADEPNNKNKKVQKIRFARTIRCKRILSRSNYSEKEMRRCWYTESDLIKRHARIDLAVLKLDQKKPPKENETFRGLEYMAKRTHEKSERRRTLVTKAVLKEQETQKKSNTKDGDEMAYASLNQSRESTIIAIQKAMDDMKEAFHHCDNSEIFVQIARLKKQGKPALKIEPSFQIQKTSSPHFRRSIPASENKSKKVLVPHLSSPKKLPLKGRCLRHKTTSSRPQVAIGDPGIQSNFTPIADPPGSFRRFASIRLEDPYTTPPKIPKRE